MLQISKQLSKIAALDSKNWSDESKEDCFDKIKRCVKQIDRQAKEINTDNETLVSELPKENKVGVSKTKGLPVLKQLSTVAQLDSKNWSSDSEEDCFKKIKSCFKQTDRQSKVIKWLNSSPFNGCSEDEYENSQIKKTITDSKNAILDKHKTFS